MEYVFIYIYGYYYGISMGLSMEDLNFNGIFLTVIMTGIGESSCAIHGTLDKMDNMTEMTGIYDWNI